MDVVALFTLRRLEHVTNLIAKNVVTVSPCPVLVAFRLTGALPTFSASWATSLEMEIFINTTLNGFALLWVDFSLACLFHICSLICHSLGKISILRPCLQQIHNFMEF